MVADEYACTRICVQVYIFTSIAVIFIKEHLVCERGLSGYVMAKLNMRQLNSFILSTLYLEYRSQNQYNKLINVKNNSY